MTPKEKQLYAVFHEVRTCFNQMKSLAEQLHQDLGVNPSMRAVMEALSAKSPQTVPDIAKSKGVSRQHIQTVMNSLQKEGFVDTLDNPAHKRSSFFDLTSKGRKVFTKIKEREKAPLHRLAATMSSESLECAQEALLQLNQHLNNEILEGGSNGKSS
jgi:DNA-binding MarR family transcriptional regulator